jgi:hypothetical protein
MTLGNSARLAKQNPIEYLSRCLEFSDDTAINPQLWMPWNHEDRWKELREQKIAARESATQKGYITAHRVRRQPSDPDAPVVSRQVHREFSLPD